MKPFLKWAGGKGHMLGTLTSLLPLDWETRRYVEPFLGGGALFFALEPKGALLADLNPDLILAYRELQAENYLFVVDALRNFASAHDEDMFYKQRAAFNQCRKLQDLSSDESLEQAARFIYLNKTCFNGLYRVNKKGEFNVPSGRRRIGAAQLKGICDRKHLEAVHELLQDQTIACWGFETLLHDAEPNDFIYMDPPYVPGSDTANFTAYTQDGFDPVDQRLLCDVFDTLDRRGCKLMLTNRDTPDVRDLYVKRAVGAIRVVDAVETRRSMNRSTDGDLIIRNYEI